MAGRYLAEPDNLQKYKTAQLRFVCFELKVNQHRERAASLLMDGSVCSPARKVEAIKHSFLCL